jgi:hypothetical protein
MQTITIIFGYQRNGVVFESFYVMRRPKHNTHKAVFIGTPISFSNQQEIDDRLDLLNIFIHRTKLLTIPDCA